MPAKQNESNEIDEDDIPDEEDEEEEFEEEVPRAVVVETDFKFSDFVNRFANVKVVKAMTILLQHFEKNTDEVNHYVTKMLHRIAWDCKMPGMIFQASIFRVFQRILESKQPRHLELQKFAVFVIRRFFEVAQKNRKAYMELLFWKTTRDATAVVDGYNAETDNKKVSRALWTEAEEDELRTLFMEHQTNNYPQDLINWILEHINQQRTRRGIMKKLKELCLIVNSKAVRSEIQKRLPKEWSEDEISLLAELWEQLKDDDDPVDLIFNGLTIKRPKPKIKEKLLELGLAADRKELRKKRSRKSNPGSGSNSDEDEDSDKEAGKSSGRRNTASNKPASKGTKKSAKKQPTVLYTDAQLSGLLKDVIQKNMSESLQWIKESLQDVLDDEDEESMEGIPLVPLTDYSSAAMDSPSFQKLLRAIGMAPPADEQELYWRIPANMLKSMIQKRCNLIENALAGNFIAEEFESTETRKKADSENEKNSDSDDDVDVLETVKKYFNNIAEPQPSTSRETVPENDINSKRKSSKNIAKRSKPLIKVDTENKGAEPDNLTAVGKSKSKKRIRKLAKVLANSSDSEMETEINADENLDKGKRYRSGSSDEANETVKKLRLLDSDEEMEPLTSRNSVQKSNRTIISDDEEEPKQNQHNQQKSLRVIISDDED